MDNLKNYRISLKFSEKDEILGMCKEVIDAE